jgi:hypothetical protein
MRIFSALNFVDSKALKWAHQAKQLFQQRSLSAKINR